MLTHILIEYLMLLLPFFFFFFFFFFCSKGIFLTISDFTQKFNKRNSKQFLSTLVAYRYYTPIFWFLLHRKRLNHSPVEFATRKQGAIPDNWTRQDQKSLFSVRIQENDFKNTMLLLERWYLVAKSTAQLRCRTVTFLEQRRQSLTLWQRFGQI